MASFIKIGDKYVNLDRVRGVVDMVPTSRQNQLTVQFGGDDDEAISFTGQEADNLRTWLNSVATDLSHLHLDSEGG